MSEEIVMINNSSQRQILISNGKKYDIMSIEMKILFLSQDIWNLVEKVYVEL